MSAWDKFKNVALVIGVIVDVTVILGWLGIDREAIGSTASAVFYVISPFVLTFASVYIGWRLREIKADADTVASRFSRLETLKALPVPTKRILLVMLNEGMACGNIRDPGFHQLYKLGMIQGPPQFDLIGVDSFILKPDANRLLQENYDEIFDGLDSGEDGDPNDLSWDDI